MVVVGQCSEYRNEPSGVPQASVLGPLLFILYTSDVWSGLENKLVAYADDATFFLHQSFLYLRDLLSLSH